MYYRAGQGLVITEADQCRTCQDNVVGQFFCRSIALLESLMRSGFQLEVLYCPQHKPRLDTRRGR